MIDPTVNEELWISPQREVVRQRMAWKQKLAGQCTRYYPVIQHDAYGAQQVAAAATMQGAVTIRDMMALRNPDAEFSVGAASIVMSDALIALEFEPNNFERDLIARKAASALATMHDADHVDPAYVKKMLEEVPKDGQC